MPVAPNRMTFKARSPSHANSWAVPARLCPLQIYLAGVSPADFPTFAAAIVLSLAMTLLGSLFPALRAARLDPVIVMRSE